MSNRIITISVTALSSVAVLALGLIVVPSVDAERQREVEVVTIPRLDVRHKSPALCPVHGEFLSEDIVPVSYGLPDPSPRFPGDSYSRQKELFPYANVFHRGGCVVTGDSPEEARVRFCQGCRDAHTRYFAEGARR